MASTSGIFRVGLAMAILILLLQGCASRPSIRSEYDHTTDFARYHTFGFFKKLATDNGYESLTTKYLKEAVTAQMESLAYRYSQTDPDLLINFNIKLKDKQSVRTTGYPAGYYGYRWGYYGAWGGYNDTYVYEYTEGTLNIDLVDRVRKQMVWEGVAVGKVSQKDIDNQEAVIKKVVGEIFKKFPFKNQPGG